MLKISIKNKKFNVKSLFTDRDKSEGMMYKKFDKTFNGMLFFMNQGKHCFWMKNCIINLDIIIIENNSIKKIHHNCEPCWDENCENFCGVGNIVLELLGGTCKHYGFKEGDLISF
jgi:uncharacterized membrane protein (UPF0127 family)